jgi:acyl carrier protein
MDRPTSETAIRARIKDIIAHVAGLDATRIGDDAALRDELSLDSLSLLEIGVDVDYAFQLGLPDERYRDIRSIGDMVALVRQSLSERAPGGQAPEAQAASA